MEDWLEDCNGSIRLRVRARPRASRTEIAGEHGGALRVRLAAPPVEGAANRELVRFLARTLGVSGSAVRVVSGKAGRSKIVEVAGVDAAVARSILTR